MSATSRSSGASAYAQALFEAAEAEGRLAGAHAASEALAAVAEAWGKDRRLRGYFLSSEVNGSEKRAGLGRLAEKLPRLVGNFLRLLLQKGRLELLPDISGALTVLIDRKLGRVAVSLVTAVPMPPERVTRWTETLRAALGQEPVLKNVVRPDLVAGAVLRIGDTVADGSVRRRLAELQRAIVEHAAP